jgi:membrane fusion protein (multidrug efflux system)
MLPILGEEIGLDLDEPSHRARPKISRQWTPRPFGGRLMNPIRENNATGASSRGRVRTNAVAVVTGVALALAQLACGDSNGVDRTGQGATVSGVPQARLRVRIERVKRARLAGGDRVTGTVRAFHRATVTAETQGRVVARGVDAGADVEAGGLLISLESSRLELELRRTQASLRAARTVLAHAKREFERAEQLMAKKAISSQHHDDLRHAVERASDEIALAEVARDTAKRNLEDAQITAPFTGTVDSLAVNVGDFVAPGTPVATLVDLSRVRIFGGVTAREAMHLEPGTIAQISFADLGGATFEATLKSVGHVAGRADGTYEIEFWMDSGDVPMRDGLVAQIDLPESLDEPSLLSPRAAVLRRDGHPEVFVVTQENGVAVARTRRLRTGRSEGKSIEVLDGLEEGDLVVWDGHFALEDGSIVVVDGMPPVVASTSGSPE